MGITNDILYKLMYINQNIQNWIDNPHYRKSYETSYYDAQEKVTNQNHVKGYTGLN